MIITNSELRDLGPGIATALGEWLESITTLFDALHAANTDRLAATPAGTLRSYSERLRALHKVLGKELDRRGQLTVDKALEAQLKARAGKAANAGDDWIVTSGLLSDSVDAVTVYIGIAPMFLRATPDTVVVALHNRINEVLSNITLDETPDYYSIELRVNQRSDQVKASVRNRLRKLGV